MSVYITGSVDTRRRSANTPTAVNGTFNISKIYRLFGAATVHLTCFAWRVCKYDRKTAHPRVHSPPAAARPLAPGGRPWQQRHRRQRQRGEKEGREEGKKAAVVSARTRCQQQRGLSPCRALTCRGCGQIYLFGQERDRDERVRIVLLACN